MKVLELFSGTECMSNAFRARGHECFTVDWERKFPSTLHIDIMELTAERILQDFGRPDIIWSGNDCTTFSVAAIGHHRMKNPITGSLDPKTEKAARADMVNRHTLDIIRELSPRFFFIENPMGGLRKMDYMRGIPRHMITYCQYGFTYRKATDIFTNHPRTEFKPPCKNGDPCHQSAPRGTKQGLQGIQDKALRSAYPPALCEHIVDICERYFDMEPLPVKFGTIKQLTLFDGEVGEFAGKVAKAIRKGQVKMLRNGDFSYHIAMSREDMEHHTKELQKEAGDILWQLSGLCSVMGWRLEDIAQQNLDKLADRKSRQVIDGSGDDR